MPSSTVARSGVLTLRGAAGRLARRAARVEQVTLRGKPILDVAAIAAAPREKPLVGAKGDGFAQGIVLGQ